MAELTRDAIRHEELRQKALDILEASQARDYVGYARAVDWFVRNYVTLVDEAEELLIHPIAMLGFIRGMRAYGDCDDVTMMAGSLLYVLGFRVRYKAVLPAAAGHMTHVFLEFQYPRRESDWIPMDVTAASVPAYPGDIVLEEV